MLRKAFLLIILAIVPAVLPAKAQALAYVDYSRSRTVVTYSVQYRCPKSGQWIDYRKCTTGQQVTQAMYEVFGKGYTARYIAVDSRTYYWAYRDPRFPNLGYWTE